jgi:hypothetical protein
MWPKEEIPNSSSVLLRVHKSLIPDGEVRPNVFRDQGAGMSVDWRKYSTPFETRNRGKIPGDNAVISLSVGGIRQIEGLVVEHDPVQENSFDRNGDPLKPNRAHSLVIGEKTTERRLKLSRIEWRWEMRIGE